MKSRAALAVCAIALYAVCQGCYHGFGGDSPAEMFNTKWTYNESSAVEKHGLLSPKNWKKSFGTCDMDLDMSEQSPIDIQLNHVVVDHGGVLPLTFHNVTCSTVYKNVGWTLSAMPSHPESCAISFKTAAGTQYKFYEAHLHWHQYYNHRGTEHKVNGQSEAVEAHLVHYNARFASIEDAFEDGEEGNIAIIAVRYTVAPTAENATEAIDLDAFIAKTYPSLRFMNTNFSMTGDALDPYLLFGRALSFDNVSMFYYNGSLTTPRCDSVVSWFIVQETIMLSLSQIHQLRLFTHINATEERNPKLGFNNDANIRPVAPLNGRTVLAWPSIVPFNASSDSAPPSDEFDYGMLEVGLGVAGGVILVAILIIVIATVVSKKKNAQARDGEYQHINT